MRRNFLSNLAQNEGGVLSRVTRCSEAVDFTMYFFCLAIQPDVFDHKRSCENS